MVGDGAEGRRGRPPRAEPAAPSGYRLTGTTKREIDIARGFFAYTSTQQLIDEAVRAFLRHLRQTDAGYAVAIEALSAKIGGETSVDD